MIVTYYRCCCCGNPLKERKKEVLFCERCAVILRDERERQLFEKVYGIKVETLYDFSKRKRFLKQFDWENSRWK